MNKKYLLIGYSIFDKEPKVNKSFCDLIERKLIHDKTNHCYYHDWMIIHRLAEDLACSATSFYHAKKIDDMLEDLDPVLVQGNDRKYWWNVLLLKYCQYKVYTIDSDDDTDLLYERLMHSLDYDSFIKEYNGELITEGDVLDERSI